jgi:hypothetical protein
MALPHQRRGLPPSPILKDFRNIECRDAVLACDGIETGRRRARRPGQPLGRPHHEDPPGHRRAGARRNARVPLQRYINPRQATRKTDAASETLLVRLVALNAERAAEEAARPRCAGCGRNTSTRPPWRASRRWLSAIRHVKQAALTTAVPTSPSARQAWPAALPEQVAAVAKVLAAAAAPLSEAELAARFTGKGAWKKRLSQIVDTLEALGRVRRQGALLASAG